MQTVYAHGGGGGSQQREVADGADVVFTDTGDFNLEKEQVTVSCISDLHFVTLAAYSV